MYDVEIVNTRTYLTFKFKFHSHKVLTVAYPHLVLQLWSIDSTISTPTSNRYGSFVALYKYITLSINSEMNNKLFKVEHVCFVALFERKK